MNKPKRKYVFYFFIIYAVLCLFINYQNSIFSFFYNEKTWVHRVNSITKLKEVQPLFKGIELDIVFNNNTNTYDVNHPPAKSINLTLNEYFSSVDLNIDSMFWLDFKNLTKDNYKNASNRLDSICIVNNINKSQLIIESTKPQYLNLLSKKGYKTSFYLPANLVGLGSFELEKKIKSINNIITQNKTTYLSTDKRDYAIVKKNFPNHKLLLWTFYYFNKKTINPYHLLFGLNYIYHKTRILPNNNVHAVLFKYDAQKGNR